MAETPALDHLAIACRNLDEGAAWAGTHPGILPDAGGRHPRIGTHNRLRSLGRDNAPGEYPEIIAIDPDAPAPGLPRRFGLDRFDGPPRLVGGGARTTGAPDQPGATRNDFCDDFSRDNLHWRFSPPDDGAPLDDGITPALIDWQDSLHPASRLPDHGLRLPALDLPHPQPLPALPVDDPRTLCGGAHRDPRPHPDPER